MTSIREMQIKAWRIAENSGFHEGDGKEDKRSNAKVLALIHSEVSEALEADRENNEDLYGEELADIVIRVLDHAQSEGIDLQTQIEQKCRINKDREWKHGKDY